MADEVGEDKEMDDKERMRDLAPVSLSGRGGGRGEHLVQFPSVHFALLPLISTATHSTKMQPTYAHRILLKRRCSLNSTSTHL